MSANRSKTTFKNVEEGPAAKRSRKSTIVSTKRRSGRNRTLKRASQRRSTEIMDITDSSLLQEDIGLRTKEGATTPGWECSSSGECDTGGALIPVRPRILSDVVVPRNLGDGAWKSIQIQGSGTSSAKEDEQCVPGTSDNNISLSETNVREDEPCDETESLSQKMEKSFGAIIERTLKNNSSRFVNRLTTAKDLPSFDGNRLEWLHFKEAYNLSTELGGYSERENFARLFNALKGEAREKVGAMLATNHNVAGIMQMLELYYGNKDAIARDLISQIKELPSLSSGKISLLDFAAKIKNTAAAFVSMNMMGYLHARHLIDGIMAKLPETILLAYYREVQALGDETPEFLKLTDFLYKEAEEAERTGRTYPLELMSNTLNKSSKSTRHAYVLEEREELQGSSSAVREDKTCPICNKIRNHTVAQCDKMKNASINERWGFVKSARLCFLCLNSGHRCEMCRTGNKCVKCGGLHHAYLHNKRRKANQNEMTQSVYGDRGVVKAYALLDEGSSITLLDNDLAERVGIKGISSRLSITGIGGELKTESKIANVEIRGALGIEILKGANIIKNLNLSRQTIEREIIYKINKEMPDVKIDTYCDAKANILIGQDNWRTIITREHRPIKGTDLVISRCLLGWVLHGPIKLKKKGLSEVMNTIDTDNLEIELKSGDSCDILFDKLMRAYFDVEIVGITEENSRKIKYDHAIVLMENTTINLGIEWETGLIWNRKRIPDTDGLITAKRRLKLLEKRLDRDHGYAELYYNEMDRFIKEGYAKIVDRVDDDTRKWYLPHFGVINENKPGKIRLVFDAAAKTNGISLNDQLDTGPDLLKSLPGVILRFRQYAVAFKGDIRDMFLRVKVRKEDRGAQRFLWRDKNRQRNPDVYEMSCLIFGAKSSPCSAIFVKNKNAKRFENLCPDAARSIERCSYMDDYISSVRTEIEATKMITTVIDINRHANFDMHSWACNRKGVLSRIGWRDIVANNELRFGEKGGQKILGLVWDNQSDELRFNIAMFKIKRGILEGKTVPTKREVLGVIMSVFDPLGLLAPFTLKSKLLMQSLWKSGIAWDEKVEPEEYGEWKTWLEVLKTLTSYHVQRCLIEENFNSETAQLHVFCDASKKAYATVAYLRTSSVFSEINIRIIMAKGRVAPMKLTKTPRLELQAALLGARLSKFIETELDIRIEKKFYWTDSSIVLTWIRKEPHVRNVFVENRLIEIAELTKITEWNWISSANNPADYATRDKPRSNQEKTVWFDGPEFLKWPEKDWPAVRNLSREERDEADALERKERVNLILLTQESDFTIYTRLLGWPGVLNVARRINRFVNKWNSNVRVWESSLVRGNSIKFWLRTMQSEVFNREMKNIKNNKEIEKSSKIIKFNSFIDEEGILRVYGRALVFHADEFNNFPIILDGKHKIVKYYLKEWHLKRYHASSETIINDVRQQYHVLGIRVCLKTIVAKCVGCKLRRGKPSEPLMGTLPEGRLAYKQRPFSHCGLDYFGPMLIKIGRRREKRWGVLFTCLTTRAIHLELASSLNTASAIMAIQRLAARRGVPFVIYSDNGTNFKSANRELKNEISLLDRNKLESFAKNKEIVWKFNPPHAPHMGGIWERLIRSVKTALGSALKEQVVSEEVLYTTLVEIEHAVNSRPLTHVSMDPLDPEALTPNHFLIGSSSGELKLMKFTPNELCIRRQWRISQRLADAFWKRWLKEYLPNILSRQKWNKIIEPIEEGDLVLIVDFQAPRNTWERGIIVRAIPGRDEQIRIAEIKTSHGTVVRPAHRLIKLTKKAGLQN